MVESLWGMLMQTYPILFYQMVDLSQSDKASDLKIVLLCSKKIAPNTQISIYFVYFSGHPPPIHHSSFIIQILRAKT
jgi:hypothetical protein